MVITPPNKEDISVLVPAIHLLLFSLLVKKKQPCNVQLTAVMNRNTLYLLKLEVEFIRKECTALLIGTVCHSLLEY